MQAVESIMGRAVLNAAEMSHRTSALASQFDSVLLAACRLPAVGHETSPARMLSQAGVCLPGRTNIHDSPMEHAATAGAELGVLSDNDVMAAVAVMVADVGLRRSIVKGLALFRLAAGNRDGQQIAGMESAAEIAAMLETTILQRWQEVGEAVHPPRLCLNNQNKAKLQATSDSGALSYLEHLSNGNSSRVSHSLPPPILAVQCTRIVAATLTCDVPLIHIGRMQKIRQELADL